MMTAARSRLIDRLPAVRGTVRANAPLARFTWFRVGGPAEVLFTPADLDDLQLLLGQRPAEVPVTVLGVGSNVLIRDGGIDGVVIRLGRAFAAIEAAGMEVRAGAAALDMRVARAAETAGIAGLEFLAGVPGTIGGAVRMNAGAYGHQIGEVIETIDALDEHGERHRVAAGEIAFHYRHSDLPESWICTAATLAGHADSPVRIGARMAEITAEREAAQPIRTRTGGSTFTNPPATAAGGLSAWQLIERAGCRGLALGGAKVSEKHCNFLINTGSATAADLEALGEEVRRRVRAATGVRLEWEIRRLGRAAGVAEARP